MKATAIPIILSLQILCSANIASAKEHSYVVREITGTVETRGWEQPLIEANPNLAHWHWDPIRDNVQGVHPVSPSGHNTITGSVKGPVWDPAPRGTEIVGSARDSVPPRPYITLYRQEKKEYISLPAEQPRSNVPYISLPPRPQPKDDYIKLEPRPLERTETYLRLSEQSTAAQLTARTPYITLYKPKKQAPYIDIKELSGSLEQQKLAGKLMSRQTAATLTDRDLAGTLSNRELHGCLANKTTQGRLVDRRVAAEPLQMAQRPAPAATPLPSADSYDDDFMYASSAIGSSAQGRAHVRGKLLAAHDANALRSVRRKHH